MATTISVTGMSCDGCEDIVEGALEEVDGVEDAEADQETNTATVEGDARVEDLVEAVDTAGYEGAESADDTEADDAEADDEETDDTEADDAEEAEEVSEDEDTSEE